MMSKQEAAQVSLKFECLEIIIFAPSYFEGLNGRGFIPSISPVSIFTTYLITVAIYNYHTW